MIKIALATMVLVVFGGGRYACAETVEGLYQVAVAVDSQSAQDLRQATREGLRTVFIRLTGSAEGLASPLIKDAVSRAARFTKQYQYERRQDMTGSAEQLLVVVEFEQSLVDASIRAAGLALWSSNRPSILLWLAVEDLHSRRFISAETDPAIVQAISTSARRLGLVIKLPTLDLEDMVALSVDDIWRQNPLRIREAAERYQADGLLTGHINLLGSGELLGQWSYRHGAQNLDFDGASKSPDDYIGQAMDQLANLLARQYAVAPVDIVNGGVLLRLSGVDDFVDYAQAISYLESLAAVRHANVVHIQGSEIVVRLIADGLLSQLQQVFSLDKRLLPASDIYLGDYAIDLDYLWPAGG